METACNLFHNNSNNNNNNNNNNSSRGPFYNFTHFAWDNNINNWELATPSSHSHSAASHYDLFHHPPEMLYGGALYGGGVSGPHNHPDPHLMCLKLGKRNYFEDPNGRNVSTGLTISKRGRGYCDGGEAAVTVAIPATVPRCQVEGCHVALLNAKEYHRRHKVCELHSKAPKVVVLGMEQRFCQQCSRFHLVTEFDDTKRSCRRRLAGHNERRRKSSQEHSTTVIRNNNPSQGRALSLLSSRNDSSISSPDLSSRCSAALRELIAENRAALLAKQFVFDKVVPFHHAEDVNVQQNNHSSHHHYHHHPLVSTNESHMFSEPQGWDRFDEPGTNNVTLDLMQAPTSAFELLSMRGKSKEDEECSQLWSSFS
ncbi:hypothetical protein ACET3Z_013514 [Daucus carota]